MYICVYIYMYVCIYIYVYMCIYICIFIYIHTMIIMMTKTESPTTVFLDMFRDAKEPTFGGKWMKGSHGYGSKMMVSVDPKIVRVFKCEPRTQRSCHIFPTRILRTRSRVRACHSCERGIVAFIFTLEESTMLLGTNFLKLRMMRWNSKLPLWFICWFIIPIYYCYQMLYSLVN